MLKKLKVYTDLDFLKEFDNVVVYNIDPPEFLTDIVKKKHKSGIIVLFSGGDYDYYDQAAEQLDQEVEWFKNNNSIQRFYVVITWQPVPQHIQTKYQNIIKFYYVPSMYAWYSTENLITNQEFDLSTRTITKSFLSLNNRATWYRQALFYLFVSNSLLDKSYFSYHMEDRFNEGADFLFETGDAAIRPWFDQYLPGFDLASVRALIPYRESFDSAHVNYYDWGIGNANYYTDTFCSIVTETYTNGATDLAFLTEKTFKPIMFKHPFLGFFAPGSLALLQELGFKTFGDVFNEDYDSITNDQQRFSAMSDEILRISSWPNSEYQKVTKHLAPRLEYNYQHMKHTLPTIFAEQMVKIKQDICNTIREKRKLLG